MKTARNFLKQISLAAISITCLLASNPVLSQGKNGTTLAAYKTIDICSVSSTTWRYSGVVALWNEGAVPTEGLVISDFIQYKTGTTWMTGPTALSAEGVIPNGTTQATAILFPYSVDAEALPGTIRNVASISITNHSGSLGTPKGPEPKATFMGEVKPCASTSLGCTYTQGYWENKPDVVWPSPYARTAPFYISGMTWQAVLESAVNSAPGYYQLAHQLIAASLNIANGASAPAGISTTMTLANAWLTTNPPASCSGKDAKCGLQRDWAAILDQFNNGKYPGGPPHCQ